MSENGGARILKANARRGLGKTGQRRLGMNQPSGRFTHPNDQHSTMQGTRAFKQRERGT